MSKDGAGGLIGLYMGLCILLGDLNYTQDEKLPKLVRNLRRRLEESR